MAVPIAPLEELAARAGTGARELLLPYIPRPALELGLPSASDDAPAWRAVEGTLVFGDISGFTKMSERLARHGKVGAEEVADGINQCFEQLLDVAYRCGGSLLKFGGDALLLLFDDENHLRRAAVAAVGMRAALRRAGRLESSAGHVTLRISIGLHTGTVHLFSVGESHRELVVTGRGASEVVAAEGAASAGEIVVSPAACAVLPSRYLGPWRGEGRLLRSLPGGPSGQPVFPDVPAGIELARFVPVEIRSHLMAGGVEPEHRTATVAFCHFDGTDDLLEQHGPGELGRRLDVVVRRIQEAAADHGVTFLGSDVDRDGGKVILVSGVPRHRGNDEERMLLTLRRIADQDLPLPLRIGVNRGPVFSGDVGTRYRRTFTVMGDTVNLAARVMAKAQGGQVLATSSVLDHSRRPFETEALEPFTVKGKRRPVVAHVVGPPRSLRLRSDLLPLTGRHDELRSLVADLDRAADGAGRVVFLVGEEGSGKSRLVDELSRAAGPQRSTIVVCEEYEHSSPYSASARVGRALLGLEPQCDPHSLGERLTAAVGRQVPELLPHLPLIGTGLGLAIADTPDTAALEPQFRRAAVERWTARLFLALRPPPHLLVVEDVHHMDDASQGVIRQLVYDQGSSPGVLCLTSRLSSEGLAVPVADHVRTITLRPLTVDEAVRALVEASRHDPMLPHDVRFLAERCMGNPSFLEELWRARRAGLPLEVLPDSVDDAVAADIDRLPPPHRHLLRCASVLGTTFCQEDLDAVVAGDDNERSAGPRPDSLDEFLDSSDSGAIRFRSPLVRECAYEGLAFRLRRQLHGRAADAMVARLGEHATDQAALLSLHCLHAQRYRDAWNFGRAAAAEAAARYANVDAARLYERALTAAHRLSEIPDSARASAWEACGDVLDRAGDYTQAARAYRRARSLLGQDTLSQAQLCLKEAWMPERVGRFADAVRWIQRGLRLLADVDDVGAGRLRAQLQALLGGIRQAQGRSHEAVRCCENALAEARSSGERKAEAQALYLLDWAWATLGRLDLAVHSPRALEIYRQLGDLGGEAVTLNNMGAWAYFRGEWDTALTLYGQSRDARLLAGNDVAAAMGTCNIGEILADQGRHAEGRQQLEEALQVAQAAHYRYMIGYTSMLLGRLASRTHCFEEAHEYLKKAKQEFVAGGIGDAATEADAFQAECLVLEGRGLEALTLADRLVQGPGQSPGERYLPLLHRVRGYALLQSGDLESAAKAFEESRGGASAQKLDYELAMTMVALATLARLRGELDTADDMTRTVESLMDRLGIVYLPHVPLGESESLAKVAGTASGPVDVASAPA